MSAYLARVYIEIFLVCYFYKYVSYTKEKFLTHILEQ